MRIPRPLGAALLAVAVSALVAGCDAGAQESDDGPGSVPVAADTSGRAAVEHASALGDGRAPTEAGWARRQVGQEPVLVAESDAEPLTVQVTGLDPDREHAVLVGYVLPLAAGDANGWGLRAALADDAGGGDLARLDHTHRRHQPDPANPWVFEATVGRAEPDADGTLEVVVDALDGAETGLASVRALPTAVLDEIPARRRRELAGLRAPTVPDSGSADFPAPDDYLTVLQRWPAYAERGVTEGYGDHDRLAYFGDGTSGEQGMRPLSNLIYVYALLAADEDYDPTVSGLTRAQLERRARQGLRYMTRTHTTGDLVATDNEAWGAQWQSAWWASRMAGGAMLLWDRLHDDERARVQRVLVAEADRQLERDPPTGEPDNSKAEENAWNAEVLAWAVALLPDHPRAEAWGQALDRWAMNTLSVGADRRAERAVEGRSVRAWNETVNVNDDFTIENHGAYHPGYMALPLQSLTWGVYALTAAGEPVPETLLHNHREVWQRLGASYLGGGQFLYPGGKDWPQHAYGLYAVLPPSVLRQRLDGDPLARTVEADRMRILEWEQRLWGDGGFASGRFTGRPSVGWDAEFDSDAAASVGMAYHLGEVLDEGAGLAAAGDAGASRPERLGDDALASRLAGGFSSPGAGFAAARRDDFVTAFGWRTLGCCFGSVSTDHDVLGVVVADDPHLVAWDEGQLAGSFSLAGSAAQPLGVRWHDSRPLPEGGYATLGVRWIGGSAEAPRLDQQLAMVSLPELGRALVLDQPVARRRVRLTSSTGLDLHVTNDVFNRLQRRLVSGERELTVAAGSQARDIELPARWVNVDGGLGVVADGTDGTLELRTRAERNLAWDSLRAETVRWRPTEAGRAYAPGETVRRLAFGFHSGGPAQTRRLAQAMGMLDTGRADVAAAWVQGETGGEDVTVIVAANFANRPRELALDAREIPGARPSDAERELSPRSVEVWRP